MQILCLCEFNESHAATLLQGWKVLFLLFTQNSNLHQCEDSLGIYRFRLYASLEILNLRVRGHINTKSHWSFLFHSTFIFTSFTKWTEMQLLVRSALITKTKHSHLPPNLWTKQPPFKNLSCTAWQSTDKRNACQKCKIFFASRVMELPELRHGSGTSPYRDSVRRLTGEALLKLGNRLGKRR